MVFAKSELNEQCLWALRHQWSKKVPWWNDDDASWTTHNMFDSFRWNNVARREIWSRSRRDNQWARRLRSVRRQPNPTSEVVDLWAVPAKCSRRTRCSSETFNRSVSFQSPRVFCLCFVCLCMDRLLYLFSCPFPRPAIHFPVPAPPAERSEFCCDRHVGIADSLASFRHVAFRLVVDVSCFDALSARRRHHLRVFYGRVEGREVDRPMSVFRLQHYELWNCNSGEWNKNEGTLKWKGRPQIRRRSEEVYTIVPILEFLGTFQVIRTL